MKTVATIKRRDLEKGMILSEFYLVIGITDKEIDRLKDYIRKTVVKQKLIKEDFCNVIFRGMKILTVTDYTKDSFSLPCTNEQLHYISTATFHITNSITEYVNLNELDFWLLKSNVNGSITFGSTYRVDEAFDILYSYYMELFLPYDDFRKYLRKARKKGLESFPKVICYQNRHLYYGMYLSSKNKVLFEVIDNNYYQIMFGKHNDIEFQYMTYPERVWMAWDLGYDMSNIVLQKDL